MGSFGGGGVPAPVPTIPPGVIFGGNVSGGFIGGGGAIQRFSQGGVVHRDSVPALLEPGEFVLRKPVARAIGGPALHQMNATGQSAPPVNVNITNKGTPQDAKVAQPKFDAQGMVIDIVLNDMKNNGPIKQSMRSGGKR